MLDRIVRRRITRMFPAVVACGVVAALSATPATYAGPADSKSELPVDRGVMQRVADFTLKDVATDRPVSLYSFVGKKAIVLVFLGTDCPVGNLYVPRLIELNQEYKKKGAVFLAINSNAHETQEQVAKFVRETGIDFPVLKDVQNKVSDTVLAERTCETLVLDGFGRIRYRGAIDDQYTQGKAKDKPAAYLRQGCPRRAGGQREHQGAGDASRRLFARPRRSQAGRTRPGRRGSGRRRPRSRRSLRPASAIGRSRSARSPTPPTPRGSSRTSASRATGPGRSGRSPC